MPQRLPEYCVEDVDRHGNIRILFQEAWVQEGAPEGHPLDA